MIKQYVVIYVTNGFICNNLYDLDYENRKPRNESWYCKECIQEILPVCIKKSNINSEHSSIDPNLKNSLCQLNNFSEQETNDNNNLPKTVNTKM